MAQRVLRDSEMRNFESVNILFLLKGRAGCRL